MNDMHNLNVVHGNLKIVGAFPYLQFGHALMFVQTNILVDAGRHIRIAGLGAATIPSTTPGVDIDRCFRGATPEFIGPQCFGFGGAERTKPNDIYAFGIIAWEVGRAHRIPPDEILDTIEYLSDLRWAGSILRYEQGCGVVLDDEGTPSWPTRPPRTFRSLVESDQGMLEGPPSSTQDDC